MATKPWSDLLGQIPAGPDYKFAGPTGQCLCGNDLLAVLVTFSDKGISGYVTDGRCVACGAHLLVPTEIDDEPADT